MNIVFEGPVESPPRNSYAFQLRRTSRIVCRYWNEKLREGRALRTTQYDVLAMLETERRIDNNVSDLAKLLGMAPSTLSRSLSRLAREGFVRLEYGRDDRMRFPKITELGRTVLEKAREVVVEVAQARISTRFEKVFGDLRTRCEKLNSLMHAQRQEEITAKVFPWRSAYYESQWYDISLQQALRRQWAREEKRRREEEEWQRTHGWPTPPR